MLGNAAYSASAFADLGSGELLVVATSLSATGAIGTVSVSGNQSGLILGNLEATGGINGVTVDAGATAVTTGVSGTTAINSVSITGDATIIPVGVVAQGRVGTPTIWGRIVPDPGTVWTRIAA